MSKGVRYIKLQKIVRQHPNRLETPKTAGQTLGQEPVKLNQIELDSDIHQRLGHNA